MKTAGVVIARHIEKAFDTAARLISWLESRGVQPRVGREEAARLNRPDLVAPDQSLMDSDCVIVLGGDGSVLAAARQASLVGTPILGVDLGEFGFLSEVKPDKLLEAMENLLREKYRLEERLMLQARILRDGQEVAGSLGLNDAVITKGAISRLMHLHAEVNGRFVSDYPADGLIVATPTGSTAYSLSAGGPIVHPLVSALVITPICAHTLFTRPLVIPPSDTVEVRIDWSPGKQEEVMLTVDGQVGIELQPGDIVRIQAAEHRARFVRLSETGFFGRLQQKLNWGGEL